ncbi:matrixin family metalloprotease [Limosilactobacillus caccae]|uniref:matrixin family metalloprotease n=1 Tax=Limosilactobacillus caccae TaxID=1926284 RepID=UPI00097117A3|nr:M57 family metalloprotease [Limosilactobacillus caccae]
MNEIRFIFRLLKRLFLLGLLVGGGWLYFHNPQVQAVSNQAAWNIRERVAQLVGNGSGTSDDSQNLHLDDDNNKAQTDQQQPTTQQQASAKTTMPAAGRWASNTATVYVNTGNPTLDSATEAAIRAWNQTGAFTFKRVSDKNKANIVVTTMNRSDSDAAGLTQTSSNSLTQRYVHATVYLNTYYLTDPSYGYSQERIINTAEHELGHAIGLDHTDAVSVMQPAGSFYTIQPADVQAVNKLYSASSTTANNNSPTTANKTSTSSAN